ncbi:DNA-binding response regulator [candidate division KSB1 bacterium]|nr:MAG: DNA-binding response regulator [candidate division KSB1 bacterium]
MPKEKILIVDDEEDILSLVEYNLKKEGYRTIGVKTGEAALQLVEEETPDLIILDLMLPEMDGLEVCRILKSNENTSDIPIIMLTAKGEETDIVVGLEIGADDYVTKPFSPRVLLARTKALLRRKTKEPILKEIIQVENLVIDTGKYLVTIEGKPISLTSTEFNLLRFLAQHRGKVFTRNQLLDNVWKDETFVIDRTVDVHIRSLRKKLGSAANLIETVRGVGYRLAMRREA